MEGATFDASPGRKSRRGNADACLLRRIVRESGRSSIPEASRLKRCRLWNTGSPGPVSAKASTRPRTRGHAVASAKAARPGDDTELVARNEALQQRRLRRHVMAQNLPAAVLAHDHPGDLDRQGVLVEDEIRGTGHADDISADRLRHDVGEDNALRPPARQPA